MLRIGKKVISVKCAYAKDIFSKALGLMFRCKVSRPMIFLFEEEKLVPLHMLFVFTSIDVLFLDKDKRVVEIKADFRPFTCYNPKNKAKYVIELAPGSVKKNSIKIKDKAEF